MALWTGQKLFRRFDLSRPLTRAVCLLSALPTGDTRDLRT